MVASRTRVLLMMFYLTSTPQGSVLWKVPYYVMLLRPVNPNVFDNLNSDAIHQAALRIPMGQLVSRD